MISWLNGKTKKHENLHNSLGIQAGNSLRPVALFEVAQAKLL